MQKLRIKRQSNSIRPDTVDLGDPAIKRPPIQSVYKSKTQNRGNSKLCPFIWNSHFILFEKKLLFLMAIFEANFSKYKTFYIFLHLLKSKKRIWNL